MSNLKNSINHIYSSKELSKAQLNELIALQNTKNSFLKIKYFSPILCLFIIGLLSFYFFSYSTNNLTKIANEVIYNHKKALPTEHLASNMTDLNFKLTKLEFKIINSSRLSNYKIIGGRYCSIQGSLAAQLKIKKENIYSTLYQSDYLTVDRTKLPYKIIKDGITVLIWIEKNILFAMATNEVE